TKIQRIMGPDAPLNFKPSISSSIGPSVVRRKITSNSAAIALTGIPIKTLNSTSIFLIRYGAFQSASSHHPSPTMPRTNTTTTNVQPITNRNFSSSSLKLGSRLDTSGCSRSKFGDAPFELGSLDFPPTLNTCLIPQFLARNHCEM